MRKGPHNFPSPPPPRFTPFSATFVSVTVAAASPYQQLPSWSAPPPPCSLWPRLLQRPAAFGVHWQLPLLCLPPTCLMLLLLLQVVVAVACVVVAFTFAVAVAVAVGGPLGCQRFALLFAQHTKGQRNKQAKAAANGGATWKGGAERATLFSSECV